MKRYIKSNSDIVNLVESKLNSWIDQGQDDVDIDDAIFDLGGDESTIDELRRRGRIDKDGHYIYKSVDSASTVDSNKRTTQSIIFQAVLNIEELIDSGNLVSFDDIKREAQIQIYSIAKGYSEKDQEEMVDGVLDELELYEYI